MTGRALAAGLLALSLGLGTGECSAKTSNAVNPDITR